MIERYTNEERIVRDGQREESVKHAYSRLASDCAPLRILTKTALERLGSGRAEVRRGLEFVRRRNVAVWRDNGRATCDCNFPSAD